MLIDFLGRFAAMLLFFSPVLLLGVVVLFVLELLFGKRPCVSDFRRRDFSSVGMGILRGLFSPCTGSETGDCARVLSDKQADRNGLCVFHTVKTLWSPEGVIGIWAFFGPLFALLRGAIGLLTSLAVGFFLTPSNGLKKLRKTDPEAYARQKDLQKAERLRAKNERRKERSDLSDAARRALGTVYALFPGFLLGCAVGAGFATALPATFFGDIDLNGGAMVLLGLAAFGFIGGGSVISMLPVGFGLGLCGMGIGGVFLFICAAPLLNLTELYRMGRAVGRRKPLIYMLVNTALSFAAGLLLDDFVNAGLLQANFAELTPNPTDLHGFLPGILCFVFLCVLFMYRLITKNKQQAPEIPEGHRLVLRGLWTPERTEQLSCALSAVEHVDTVFCNPEKQEVRIVGEADFSALSKACAECGFELLILEE